MALVYMLLCAVAMPFKVTLCLNLRLRLRLRPSPSPSLSPNLNQDKGDDFFANACSFSLVAVFFFCIVIKIRYVV